jgi:hypothetical protein
MHQLPEENESEYLVARALPKPKKKVAKKKLSAEATEKFIKRSLKDLDAEVDERYEFAMKFMKSQDDDTREAISRMVDTMSQMAGRPTAHILLPGEKERTPINVDQMIFERNLFYLAVRLVIACARMDIRIAKFKMPKLCADCGRKA